MEDTAYGTIVGIRMTRKPGPQGSLCEVNDVVVKLVDGRELAAEFFPGRNLAVDYVPTFLVGQVAKIQLLGNGQSARFLTLTAG